MLFHFSKTNDKRISEEFAKLNPPNASISRKSGGNFTPEI